MKTKILLWGAVAILISTARNSPAQSNDVGQPGESGQSPNLVLSDGTKLTLLGVTYGRHHVAPNFEAIGGDIHRGNWIDSPAIDTTVVWIEAEHDSRSSFELLVSDMANTACVTSESTARSFVKAGVGVYGFQLRAFPRWDKEFILRAAPYRGEVAKGHFVIVNPQPGSFGTSTSTPLPNTQSDGDFEVTLTKFAVGAPSPSQRVRGLPTNDVGNQCVHLNFDFKQNGQSTTNWHPRIVDTSDAAGNHVQGVLTDYPTNGTYPFNPIRMARRVPSTNRIAATTNAFPATPPEQRTPFVAPVFDGYYYEPGLWPDEPVWKVRMEFTRTSGFTDDEIVTFTDLPVKTGTEQDFGDEWTWDASKTNFTFIAEKKVNGVQLKLLPPLLVPNTSQPGRKYISVIIYTDPDPMPQGTKLTVLKATDDQGRDISAPFSPGWAGHFSIEFPDPREVKTLNLKLALHRSRFVNFTVKPEKWQPSEERAQQ